MSLNRKDFLKKVRRWVTEGKRINGEAAPLTYVRLMHQSDDRPDSPVDAWEFESDTDLEAKVSEMITTAEEDCKGRKGSIQQYSFFGYFGDMSPDSGGFGAQHPFTQFSVPDVGEDNMEIAGGSSPKAQLQDARRHLETVMKMTYGPIDQNQRNMQRRIEEQDAIIAELMSNQMAVFRLQQDLLSEEARRAREDREEAFTQEMKGEAAKIVLPFLGPALGALIKWVSKDGDAPPTADPELLGALSAAKEALKALTPDQFYALTGNAETGQTGILTMPQSQLLKMALKRFMDEEEAQDKRVKEKEEEIRKNRQMGGGGASGGTSGGTSGGGKKK